MNIPTDSRDRVRLEEESENSLPLKVCFNPRNKIDLSTDDEELPSDSIFADPVQLIQTFARIAPQQAPMHKPAVTLMWQPEVMTFQYNSDRVTSVKLLCIWNSSAWPVWVQYHGMRAAPVLRKRVEWACEPATRVLVCPGLGTVMRVSGTSRTPLDDLPPSSSGVLELATAKLRGLVRAYFAVPVKCHFRNVEVDASLNADNAE